ncbi:molecular chaperone HtpG [Acetobacteraceae bacterium KSS8]|uniref:Chaperone protein HtpG n=1 Tax=Endosaccharibacter trunci TaxID=2812733 RepID=A0ABT1W4G5_9PROT|nr:molecular chaperone HtpG [Acetobacteraceae bacterium KSS8]
MSDHAPTQDQVQPGEERHEFGAEVGRLLDLVVHALYSEREIFLRELVANAADASDRRRFEALTDSAKALPDGAKVRIHPDKDARLLTISDDGIGMSREELARNLGTIARSGTRAFGQDMAKLENAKPEERPSLIGQFGVGFYAAFMIADRVEVTSRRVGEDKAWRWSSEGQGSYTLAPAERDLPGTDIVLHVKTDADEFLEPYRLETIVRKWADHITWPITIVRDGNDVAANEGTALWRKPKSDITEEQYTEFYQHLGHMFDKPWATLHWRAEGTIEFTALLFVPGMRPFEPVESTRESRVRLHVRRMFITDEAALLPPWLRFVQGVVDTEDLPLNVSREMLQATPVLARIRKAVTNRVISELRSKSKDAETYAPFWENFGAVLKEGIWEDHEHRTEVAGLSRFRSSTEQGLVSLADYVGRMKPGQEAIYYLVGDNHDALAGSPQLEGFQARGIEVLLLSDQVDAFWPERLDRFDDKPIRSVTQGLADLSAIPLTDEPADEAADVEALLPAIKDALGDAIAEARITDRLVGSAVVLAASQSGPDLQMQRLMRRTGQRMPGAAPFLEINPRHKLIRALAAQVASGQPIKDAALTLLDLARVQDGEAPADPAAFARRVADALAGAVSGTPAA